MKNKLSTLIVSYHILYIFFSCIQSLLRYATKILSRRHNLKSNTTT